MSDPISSLFLGVFLLGFLWIFWLMVRPKLIERNYNLLEDGLIRKIADKLDVDLEHEQFLQNYTPTEKTVKKAIENRIIKEYFPEGD